MAENSATAFRELVTQRIDFVYAAALRQVGGDAHLAQEVAQGVFLDLARKARALAPRPTLTGWLYTSTRFAAAKALRSRARRLTRETEAHALNELLSATASPSDAINWPELRPVLDAAMHELGERDREVVLLRFFEGRSLADVGAAVGLAENSARMRVDRALEKLRARLARRGITSTAAALGAVLAHQPVVAAPAGLAAAAAGSALALVASGGVTATVAPWFTCMSSTKITAAVVAVVLAFMIGIYVGGRPAPGAAPALSPSSDASPESAHVIAALRADDAALKTTVDRLEAERVAALAEAEQAQAKMTQMQQQLQAIQAAREAEVRVQKQRAMLNNLRQLAAARDQHRKENAAAASVADLVGPDRYLKALNAADGEDYSTLDLTSNAVLSVTSANGITATYYLPPPNELRASWSKALSAIRPRRISGRC